MKPENESGPPLRALAAERTATEDEVDARLLANVHREQNHAVLRELGERTATGGEERTYGGMTLDYLGGSNDTVTAELVAHIRELLTRGAV